MERQKQATEGSSKKRKKKKKQIEEKKKLEEPNQIEKNQSKAENATKEPTQAEDPFAVVRQYFSKILTTQQLNRLRRIHDVYEELTTKGATFEIAKSIELQYGSIDPIVLAHRKRLVAGWSNRITRLRALKQKHQADATRREIIGRFQEALAKGKTKNRRRKIKKLPDQKLKSFWGKGPDDIKIQRVYEDLENESRPGLLDSDKFDELRNSKIGFVTELKGNLNSIRIELSRSKHWVGNREAINQMIRENDKESWKKRRKKKMKTSLKPYENTRKQDSDKKNRKQKTQEAKERWKKVWKKRKKKIEIVRRNFLQKSLGQPTTKIRLSRFDIRFKINLAQLKRKENKKKDPKKKEDPKGKFGEIRLKHQEEERKMEAQLRKRNQQNNKQGWQEKKKMQMKQHKRSRRSLVWIFWKIKLQRSEGSSYNFDRVQTKRKAENKKDLEGRREAKKKYEEHSKHREKENKEEVKKIDRINKLLYNIAVKWLALTASDGFGHCIVILVDLKKRRN